MNRPELEKELQDIAEHICRVFNKIELPRIHLKHNRRGHTNYHSGYISIPIWAINEGKEYLYYYIIHELTHWILNQGHTSEFREIETEILNSYLIEPIYDRAYARALIKNGVTVWDKNTSKIFNRI